MLVIIKIFSSSNGLTGRAGPKKVGRLPSLTDDISYKFISSFREILCIEADNNKFIQIMQNYISILYNSANHQFHVL